jgi:hypothetical protein
MPRQVDRRARPGHALNDAGAEPDQLYIERMVSGPEAGGELSLRFNAST